MRINRRDYYMKICDVVSERATCNRRKVGAVLVSSGDRIISTGYNGSPKGLPHCDDAGHLIVDNHCVRTIHAEMNAILEAKNKVDIVGSTMYVNTTPCDKCILSIIQVGVSNVIFRGEYTSADSLVSFLERAGLFVEPIDIGAGMLCLAI